MTTMKILTFDHLVNNIALWTRIKACDVYFGIYKILNCNCLISQSLTNQQKRGKQSLHKNKNEPFFYHTCQLEVIHPQTVPMHL